MKRKRFYLLLIFLVMLLVATPVSRKFLSNSLNLVFKPVRSAMSSSARTSKGFFSGILEIRNIQNENSDLSAKLRQSQVDQSKIAELSKENEILKSQLGFVENYQQKTLVPAKIIGREPASYLDYITIDQGSDSGVQEGSAVVSDGALVGKVTAVSAKEATVTLITSRDSVIQAMLQDSRVMGILRGGLSGLTLENIPSDIDTPKNETVITSGLGGGIDQGILIGYVTGLRSSKAEIFKILNIHPLVDFSRLEIVFVIK